MSRRRTLIAAALGASLAFAAAGCDKADKPGTADGLADNSGARRPAAAVTARPVSASAGLVDVKGAMRLPVGYRDNYQYFGTWAVAADEGSGSKELHVVYASPGAAAAHRAKGRFPEGTVLVKEVFEAASDDMTTGRVSRASNLVGWFLMIKETGTPYPGNKLWGDGWGWAWFDKGNTTQTKTVSYQDECLGCHVPAKATDWTFTNGYPVLSSG